MRKREQNKLASVKRRLLEGVLVRLGTEPNALGSIKGKRDQKSGLFHAGNPVSPPTRRLELVTGTIVFTVHSEHSVDEHGFQHALDTMKKGGMPLYYV